MTSQVTAYPGLGFNPGFLRELAIPKHVHRIEAGPNIMFRDLRKQLPAEHLSLHISRAPFSEDDDIQDRFCANLRENLNSDISSIGLHLCGRFGHGMGWFGITTEFDANAEAVRQSHRLMDALVEFELPIVIENADFYHHDPAVALKNIEFANELCRAHGSRLILDLTHLYLCAHNLGVSLWYLLGRVDLELVSVMHLSGYVGRDVLHDGHNQAVAEGIWESAEEVLRLIPNRVDVVLEHTDPGWAERELEFRQEWQRLNALLATDESRQEREAHDKVRYATGYMANLILPKYFPTIFDRLGASAFRSLVLAWGGEYFRRASQSDRRFGAIGSPRAYWTDDEIIDPVEDFRSFLRAQARRSGTDV